MAHSHERYDSLEIVRPVEPTQEVRRFLAAAGEIASLIFENSDSVSLHLRDEDEVTDKGQAALLRRAPVFDHEIYRPGDLKMTLVSFRSPRQTKQNPFYRIYNQLESDMNASRSEQTGSSRTHGLSQLLLQNSLAHDNPSLELSVDFDELNLFSNIGNGMSNQKLALIPEMGANAMQVTEESMICLRALTAINARVMYPIPAGTSTPVVTFMRLPQQVQPQQVTEYYDALIEKLPVKLELGAPQVRYST